MIAQALVGSSGPIVVLAAGILGRTLSPVAGLATLPLTAFVVGSALTTLPMVLTMQRTGRKPVFLTMTLMGATAAVVAALAVHLQDFWLLVVACFVMGSATASSQQFRFAAIESVLPDQAGRAAARVLLGGLAAAIIGPEAAFRFRDLAGTAWAGSFIACGILYGCGFLVLLFFKPVPNPVSLALGAGAETGRSLRSIVQSPVFVAAIVACAGSYAVMTYIMTATPVHMHGAHFSDEQTKLVIQSHIVAMFLPSLVSGLLMKHIGIARLLWIGLVCYLGTAAVGIARPDLLGHWLALVVLGIGWNFLFLSGTVLLTRAYSPEEKFKTQATNDFVTFGTQATASLMAGLMLAVAGWQMLLWSTVPIVLAMALVFAWWQRQGLAEAPASATA